MIRGLVLGGGGANGGFEAHALRVLAAEYGYDQFDRIIGVSTGALQAVGLRAMGAARLAELNDAITQPDCYTKRSLLQIGWHFLKGGLGAYSLEPLGSYLVREKIITGPVDALVGYCRLDVGDFVPAVATVETVLASCAIPLVFEPRNRNLVDGGLRHVNPIGEALQWGCDEVVVITTHNLDHFPTVGKPRNIVELALRVWEIMYHEHMVNDLDGARRMNHVLGQVDKPIINRKGRFYARANILPICPSPAGLPGTLDFSAAAKKVRRDEAEAAVHLAMKARAA